MSQCIHVIEYDGYGAEAPESVECTESLLRGAYADGRGGDLVEHARLRLGGLSRFEAHRP